MKRSRTMTSASWTFFEAAAQPDNLTAPEKRKIWFVEKKLTSDEFVKNYFQVFSIFHLFLFNLLTINLDPILERNFANINFTMLEFSYYNWQLKITQKFSTHRRF